MKHIALLVFGMILNDAWGQTPLVKKWDYRYGGTSTEGLCELIQTDDGGYLLGGVSPSGAGGDRSESNRGLGDYWIVKLNAMGIKQWDKRFGGPDFEIILSLTQTKDGGYLLGGHSKSGIGGDKTQDCRGNYDYWVVKVDAQGGKMWDKRFGGANDDRLQSVLQTTDGGYLLGGYSSSDTSDDKTEHTRGADDYWLVKTDSTGNKLWDKRFGGDGSDMMWTIQRTLDGGYMLGGASNSNISGDKTDSSRGYYDFWIVKIDSSGSKQWDKRYGGDGFDEIYTVILTSDKGYYLAGRSNSGMSGDKTQLSWGLHDFWVVKTDSAGNKQWDKRYGGNDNEDAFGNAIQTADGGFLLTGGSSSWAGGDKTEINNMGSKQTWTIKTDSSGVKQWDKTIYTWGRDEIGYGLQSSEGCYIFANYTNSHIGGYKTQSQQGGHDYWLVKLCDNITAQAFYSFVSSADACSLVSGGSASATGVQGTPPYHYLWSTGDTTAAVDSLAAGIYSVTATDNVGASDICFVTIRVSTPPVVTIATNSPIICSTDSAHLCTVTGYTSYDWNQGQTDSCVYVRLGGNYYVTVTDANGCTAESNRLAITVLPLPPISISVNGDTLSVYNAVTQQWYLNGSAINGATSTTYITTQSGSYTVMVTDSNGCTATSSAVIISGIDNLGEEDVVSVYPNPITDGAWQLSVGNNFIDGKAEIFDAEGKLVFQLPLAASHSLLAPEVAKGIYLLRISSAKRSVMRKLIKL
jgi:hypothetical protein